MLLGAGIRFGHGCRQLGFLFLIIVSGGSALALSPVLGVATDNYYPPGVIRGVDGQPEGFIVDLCRFLARKTGGAHQTHGDVPWAEARCDMQDERGDQAAHQRRRADGCFLRCRLTTVCTRGDRRSPLAR